MGALGWDIQSVYGVFVRFCVVLCHDSVSTPCRPSNSGEERNEDEIMGFQLTAVKLVRVGVLLGLLVRSIGVGIGDAAGLAELAGARHVQDVDEEGGRGGGQDEAVRDLAIERTVVKSWCFVDFC